MAIAIVTVDMLLLAMVTVSIVPILILKVTIVVVQLSDILEVSDDGRAY